MEELTDSDSEDDLLEVLEGVVSITREAITFQQPSVGGPIEGGSTHPSTSTALVMESGITSEKVARISTLSEDKQHLKSKPPDTENTKFKEQATVDNSHPPLLAANQPLTALNPPFTLENLAPKLSKPYLPPSPPTLPQSSTLAAHPHLSPCLRRPRRPSPSPSQPFSVTPDAFTTAKTSHPAHPDSAQYPATPAARRPASGDPRRPSPASGDLSGTLLAAVSAICYVFCGLICFSWSHAWSALYSTPLALSVAVSRSNRTTQAACITLQFQPINFQVPKLRIWPVMVESEAVHTIHPHLSSSEYLQSALRAGESIRGRPNPPWTSDRCRRDYPGAAGLRFIFTEKTQSSLLMGPLLGTRNHR
ncbi:hypothetical protein RHGRI_037095 [Rhododendron griersonianum]|uniref:Uncharacterized protein n=1 Tax=Rhododendron griersonianum TaxID=479676 RepID=A0AAV6HU07_9ERIC|nr:hypothetical protein RHGRI_037095 [Rhododendron griersonianum]